MCDDCGDTLSQIALIAQSKRVDPDELWQMGEVDEAGVFTPYDATGWQVEARWYLSEPRGANPAPLAVWSTAGGQIAWYTAPPLTQSTAAFKFVYADGDFDALYALNPGWLSLVVTYPTGKREVYAGLAVERR
jgi:hypothetical protein